MSSATASCNTQDRSIKDENRALLAESVNACVPGFASTVAGLFAASGADPEAAARALEAAAAELRAGTAKLPSAALYPWVQLCETIAVWWRDPEYLDERGKPREIPDTGPAPSLEDLFARTIDRELWDEAKQLLGRTAARRTGDTWRYVKDSPQLPLSGYESAERLLMATVGMFATFIDNQTRRTEPVTSKNTDSTAHVAMFPAHLIPELRAKMHKRAGSMLEDADEWMTRQATSHEEGPVSLVGVSVYVFTSEPRPRPGSGARTDAESGGRAGGPKRA